MARCVLLFCLFAMFLCITDSKEERAGGKMKVIIVLALPLSGHHVLNEGLLSLNIKSSHNEVNRYTSQLCDTWPIPSARVGGQAVANTTWSQVNEHRPGCYVGQVVQLALAQGRPPLKSLIDLGYRAFTQLDVCRGDICIFPQVEAIEEITRAYPKAYYIHTRRGSLDEHVQALSVWQREGDDLLDRYEAAGYLSRYPGQAANQTLVQNARAMLAEQTRIILDFFAAQPQLRFLKVNIAKAKATASLQAFLNLTAPVPLSIPPEYFIDDKPKLAPAPAPALGAADAAAAVADAAAAAEAKREKKARAKERTKDGTAAASPGSPASPESSPSSPTASAAPEAHDLASPAGTTMSDDARDPTPQSDAVMVPDDIVILVGLPKSGTTSIQEGLRALYVKSAHFEINKWRAKPLCTSWPVPEVTVGGGSTPQVFWKRVYKADGCYVGEVLQRALAARRPPLEDMIDLGYRAFTQLDVCRGDGCIFPQVEAIEEITRAYPKAYYIHTRRSSFEAHALSMDAWDGMLDRFARGGYLSKFPGQTAAKSKLENGLLMIAAMQTETLDFFRDHGQSLRFLDVNIEEADAEAKLRAFLGTPTLRIEHKNAGHYDKKHPEFVGKGTPTDAAAAVSAAAAAVAAASAAAAAAGGAGGAPGVGGNMAATAVSGAARKEGHVQSQSQGQGQGQGQNAAVGAGAEDKAWSWTKAHGPTRAPSSKTKQPSKPSTATRPVSLAAAKSDEAEEAEGAAPAKEKKSRRPSKLPTRLPAPSG